MTEPTAPQTVPPSVPETGAETGVGAGHPPQPQDRPDLPPAARRALAEAEARRVALDAAAAAMPAELGGRKGPEPVRYGDWERKGLAIDF
jgi:hypothetical protein